MKQDPNPKNCCLAPLRPSGLQHRRTPEFHLGGPCFHLASPPGDGTMRPTPGEDHQISLETLQGSCHLMFMWAMPTLNRLSFSAISVARPCHLQVFWCPSHFELPGSGHANGKVREGGRERGRERERVNVGQIEERCAGYFPHLRILKKQ